MLHVTSSVFVPAESAWDFRDTTASDPKGVLEVSIGLVTAPPQDVHGDLVNGAPRPEREISFAASSSSSKRWAVFPLTSPVRPDQRKGAECLLLFLLWKGSCFGFQGSPGRKPAGRRRCYSRRFHPRIPPTSLKTRFVRKNRGLIPAPVICQVSDRARVRGSGRCGIRRIFS